MRRKINRMKYPTQDGSPSQGEQSGYNLRNYNFTKRFSWTNAPKPFDVSKVFVCFRPEYVQKTVQTFTEHGCSWWRQLMGICLLLAKGSLYDISSLLAWLNFLRKSEERAVWSCIYTYISQFRDFTEIAKIQWNVKI